jgi:hypothetical protein
LKIDGKVVTAAIGTPGGNGAGNYWCNIGSLAAGNHTYVITMVDSKGKIAIANGSFSVSVPSNPPTIPDVLVVEAFSGSDLDGVMEDTDRLLVTWAVAGDNAIVSKSFTVDGQVVGAIGDPGGNGIGNYWCAFSPLDAGTHTYVITVTDNLGGTATATGTFDVVSTTSGLMARRGSGSASARKAVFSSIGQTPDSADLAKLLWLYDFDDLQTKKDSSVIGAALALV